MAATRTTITISSVRPLKVHFHVVNNRVGVETEMIPIDIHMM